MNKVISKDGTLIAYERSGVGPALIVVTGALSDRAAVARADADAGDAAFSRHFTLYAYDRRGRGASGDTSPYALEREVEDIDALITEAGGSAYVFGHSSGGGLALEAARRMPNKIPKLALYEPPFIIDSSRPPVPPDFAARLKALVASGRKGDAVAYFLTTGINLPADAVNNMRSSPMWPGMVALEPTVVYDAIIMRDTMEGNPESLKKYASITTPTLVMDGGASPTFMHNSADTLAKILPHAQRRTFPGQEHGVANAVLVPALLEFFNSQGS